MKLIQRQMVFQDISFKVDPVRGTAVEFHLDHAVAKFKIPHLMELVRLKITPHIKQMQFTRLKVIVADDDTKLPTKETPPPHPHWLSGFPELRVTQISLDDCQLHYRLKNRSGKTGEISVYHINGKVTSFGTRPELSPSRVAFDVNAQLESVGEVHLASDFNLFDPINVDHLSIQVKNQNLEELNTFFNVVDGVQLKGRLIYIEASLVIRQGYLDGKVMTSYHGFHLGYKEKLNRGAFSVLFKNIAATLMTTTTRPRGGIGHVEAKVNYQRKPHQNLIKFLIGGLLPPILGIVTSS